MSGVNPEYNYGFTRRVLCVLIVVVYVLSQRWIVLSGTEYCSLSSHFSLRLPSTDAFVVWTEFSHLVVAGLGEARRSHSS